MNRPTAGFRALFQGLPPTIQAAARAAFAMLLVDPAHPGLRSHPLKVTRKGKHPPGSVSVPVTMQYRAISVVQDGINLRYWIGSHADSDTFVGRK